VFEICNKNDFLFIEEMSKEKLDDPYISSFIERGECKWWDIEGERERGEKERRTDVQTDRVEIKRTLLYYNLYRFHIHSHLIICPYYSSAVPYLFGEKIICSNSHILVQ